jgi:ParB-like chromosome segregation protein Spo0J
MKTERVPIDSIQFDPANLRRHGTKNLDAIRASLSRFGQQKPIVVDGDGIVRAGNGTLTAAKSLGWTEVTIVRTDLKGPEATAYAIADNRTAELADWDEEALAKTLASLQIADEELMLATGFDAPPEMNDTSDPKLTDDPFTVTYVVVFDDEEQQDKWYKFLAWLRERFPDAQTIGERLIAHIEEEDL